MSVVIIKQGLLDTIQDMGRQGHQHLGINPTGCMDTVAAAIANMLVGNKRDEAVIELHFPASCFQFQTNCLFAIAGANFTATINDIPIEINTAVVAPKGAVLKFNHLVSGSRCYLGVYGGWKLLPWLNSYSTNLKAGLGGYEGRALKKGDVIALRLSSFPVPKGMDNLIKISATLTNIYAEGNKIRCIKGSEYNWLNEDSLEKLESSSSKISLQSDRMGYKMQGENLERLKEEPLLSSAVTKGTVQLLPSGQLIILMADHQTTGGYPKIVNVITADLPKLAQMQPNDAVRFEIISITEAEETFLQQQQYLQQIEAEIQTQLKRFFNGLY